MSSVAGGAVGRDHLLPQLPKEEPEPGPTPTIEAPAERLDLATVMRLSQAISGEIVLEKLIDTLLRIALEQAGAERGLLVLLHHDEPRIMAQATIRGDNVQVELRDEVPTAATLPQSVLHYVLRTRQAVSLEDASAEHQFSADPYIHNRNARSILCLPLITQANLIGVLYLENNLAPRVFAPSRTAVLKLLASQAAIALEIARLHGDLAQREARIRRLVEANVISMFVGDRDGRIADASEAFLRLIGYDREDLFAGRLRWTDLTPPEWHDRTKEATAQLDSTGRIRPFEKEYLRKDGSRVPVLLGAAALEPALEDGTHQAVVFVLDLTERKRAEDELRASEARFRSYLDQATDGFFLFDDKQAIIDVNRQACEKLGYSRDEMIGMRVRDFDAGLDESSIARIRERVDSGETATFETLHRRKDGTTFPVEVRARRFQQGTQWFRLSLARDITERKRAQEEHERLRQIESDLAHFNRMSIMGELAASLAHELLHPIAAARNNARAGMRYLKARPPNLTEVEEALATIVRDADRAKEIIGRMRDHIKKAPPRREAFDVNDAINEVIATVKSTLDQNKVAVHTELTNGLSQLWGDRVQVQQVLLNLVLNAVEAMSSVEDAARALWIGTGQLQSNIVVAVRDSGPGIDPEHLERVFAPFYTTKSSGIGMGLSICRSIIAAHGGRLWVEANQPGGAIFQFTLPTGLDDT